MRNLNIALRSLFKQGRHNVTRIVSLSVGLAVALILIAKICFERSFDSFYPDVERVYRLVEYGSMNEGDPFESSQTPGAVAPAMKEEVPGIEAATRLTYVTGEGTRITAGDKRRYLADNVLMADSCLFDVLPRPVLSGDPKKVLARPGYAMISRSLAERLGGIDRVEGEVLVPVDDPGSRWIVGGVFEDVPENSHLRYDILVSLEGMAEWSRNNWVGNDRYLGYVRLAPGVTPEGLDPAIRRMIDKHIDSEEMRKAGASLLFSMKPLREMHAGTSDVRNMFVMLTILASALLFTAMMNYILIALSSLAGRSKEIALHKSYGASGSDVLRLTMTETLLHMAVSVVLAIVLIFLCRGLIEDLLGVSPETLLLSEGAVVLLGVCAAVFLVTGLVPGILFARIPVTSAFRRSMESRRIWKLSLLFLQFAAAGLLVSLLIAIGRQHRFMLDSDPGYSFDRLAFCPVSGQDSAARVRIVEEIGKLPEVERVSSCSCLPLHGMAGNHIMLPGSDWECFNVADQYAVGGGFLELMEIPLVDGRFFTEDVSGSTEIMVSRSFVERMKDFADWTDGPVGKMISITEHEPCDYTICGVYENYRIGSLNGMDSRPSVLFYDSKPSPMLLIKLRAVTVRAVDRVREKLQELMPDGDSQLTLYSSAMANLYGDSRKFRDQVLIGGIVTLLISLIGLIGYTDDETSRRRKELAVRKVHGATLREILRIFLSDILRVALPAVVLGCAVSFFVSEFWMRQFAEKAPLSLWIFVAGGAGVGLVVTACVIYRTWKAAGEDPVRNLKSE
ncbi:ABC transporter permease [Alistipes ihumii]|uniref:ABC transporter permease n=1 Tax=Alistipes ihumii TaxID=1470347 RepID=UPI002495A7F7|nr:ABC transporter permease [Alistipes ihumii]